jgi:hypothetical protein
MKYAIGMASDGTVYIQNLMKIGLDSEVILRLFSALTIREAAMVVLLMEKIYDVYY